MQGWIKLHRQLTQWEWYDDINTSRLFIHCLLKANHADNKWKGLYIKRGQFITSLDRLVTETKLTKSQIRTCLKKLISTHEIAHSGRAQHTVITIKNYESYQCDDTQNDTALARKSHSNDTALASNKNVKNVKNDNNEDNTSLVTAEPTPKKSKFRFDSEDIRFAEEMHKKIRQTNPSAPKPNFENWANTIRLMRERDGLTHKDMWLTFAWANGDHFWYQNIESPTKLRKHFSRLNNERMKSNEGNGSRVSKQGRKLTAEEELHERLLRDYGAAPSQWKSSKPSDNGMGQCGIHGGVPSQVEEGSVTIDMGDGSISPNS